MGDVLDAANAFNPEQREAIFHLIKQVGVYRAIETLITEAQYPPSVAKAVVKNIIRKRGW